MVGSRCRPAKICLLPDTGGYLAWQFQPLYTHEFGISHEALVQEAERVWKYQVGVTSDTERQERVQESIDSLRVWAKEHGKQVIDVQLPDGR